MRQLHREVPEVLSARQSRLDRDTGMVLALEQDSSSGSSLDSSPGRGSGMIHDLDS